MNSLDIIEHLKIKFQQKRKDHPSFKLLDIDDNLFPNGIITFETEALDYDNKLKTVKNIVAESWKKGEKNHLMIQGEGGIGKTVTLLSLPDKFVPYPIPAIYIPLHEVKGDYGTIEKYIKQRVLDDNEDHYRLILNLFLNKPWNNGPRLLLLLDGFNEISYELRGSISEDIEQWSEFPGIQVITSSRFDIHQYVALRSNFFKIELQPLSENTVLGYLKSNNIGTPRSSAITKLITIPLLLTLYIKTETIRREQPAPFAKFLETKNAGTLIWNYLQCELWRFRNNREEAKASVLAMEFIAPYIAWTMQQQSEFILEESIFLDEIDKAYGLMETHYANKDKFPQHIKTTLQKSKGLPDYDHIRSLLEEQLCLFINNDGHYKLMHQQFRDALAAMHLINSIYLNGNSRPTEWNHIVDHYVMQFVADLIGEDESNCLWEQNRTSPQLESATRNQLELQRRLHNCDFSKLNFSGLDLNNISLYPYRYNKTTIKLPTQPERIYKTKLSDKTFSPEGHTASVYAVAVTPDGKRFVSGSGDNTIRVWDLETGAAIGNPIVGHESSVYAVAVTPNGKHIISGSDDHTIRVWDMETGAAIGKPIEGHNGPVYTVVVTSNGKHIVSGSKDSTIRIGDLVSQTHIKTIEGHSAEVNTVAVTSDCKRIVSGSSDDTIRIWDIETGTHLRTIKGHDMGVAAITVTIDDNHIVSGSYDGTIRIWDLNTGAHIRTIYGHEMGVTAVTVTPDSKYIISGSEDNTIRIWDLESGAQIRIIKKHKAGVETVAVTPDGKRILSGSWDKTIRIGDLESGVQIRAIYGYENEVYAVAVTPDGKRIVSGGGWDNTIRIWDLNTNTQIRTIEGHKNGVNAVAVTSDCKHIVSGGDAICIWNLMTGALIRSLKGHEDGVYAFMITPDNKHIVSCGSWDKTLCIWDLETGALIRTIINPTDIYALAVTPDGKNIVTGLSDNTIRIWNMDSGVAIGNPIKTQLFIDALAMTPNGKLFISGGDAICIWDMKTRAQIRTMDGHNEIAYAVAVTSDGKVVSGSSDNTIRVWDLNTGILIRTIEKHKGEVRAIAITHDDKRIISGSDDCTICITDMDTYEVKTICILPLSVVGLDFSKAIISTPELKETLRQNGAKVDPD